ncbi:hypothetical protein HMPREF9373_1956 [Psychrobacter sp. 1501(2011)]|nr:hypothetical protein HMPREF9373_1956 [Psychrobacter sp. 1501(2011)]
MIDIENPFLKLSGKRNKSNLITLYIIIYEYRNLLILPLQVEKLSSCLASVISIPLA